MGDEFRAAPSKRRFHTKSRRGCRTCKSRHIKVSPSHETIGSNSRSGHTIKRLTRQQCDEQTPRCANCIVRNLVCQYGTPPGSSLPTSATQTGQVQYLGQHGQYDGDHHHSSAQTSGLTADVSTFQMTLAPPTLSSAMPRSTRQLELELMHRWSTRTWSAGVSVPEDRQLFQVDLPRQALKDDFLLNGIFALSAADMYLSGHAEFEGPAYRFAQQAREDIHRRLPHITKDDVIGLHAMAYLSDLFNYMMAHQTAYFRVVNSFYATHRTLEVILKELNWRPPCLTAVQRAIAPIDPWLAFLDENACLGLSFLDVVADSFHVPVIDSSTAPETAAAAAAAAPSSAIGNTAAARTIPAYRDAVNEVRRAFGEEPRGVIKLYVLFFGTNVPQHFFRQAFRYEPMAMFVFMYLGVVLYKTGQDPSYWWTRDLGKDLVEETADMLERTVMMGLEAGKGGIMWARNEVGIAAIDSLESVVCA